MAIDANGKVDLFHIFTYIIINFLFVVKTMLNYLFNFLRNQLKHRKHIIIVIIIIIRTLSEKIINLYHVLGKLLITNRSDVRLQPDFAKLTDKDVSRS